MPLTSSSAATSSSGPGAAAARCHARRSGSSSRSVTSNGACPPEDIAGDGEVRPGIRAGDFDRCERPSAGGTLRGSPIPPPRHSGRNAHVCHRYTSTSRAGTGVPGVRRGNRQVPVPVPAHPGRARKVLDDVQAAPVDKLPVEDRWVSVPAKVGDVRVRIVRPPDTPGTLPVILYMHGGGWVLGNSASHDRLVRELAVGADAGLHIHSRHAWRKDEHPDRR